MIGRRLALVLLPALLLIPGEAQSQPGYTLDSLPNPQVEHGGFVSDPSAILGAAERQQLEAMLSQLERDLAVEYAVAIVPSIGQENPKAFANLLFERWGVGKAGRDNGLLLLVVLDQRRAEFETGYGLEGVLNDAVLAQIARAELPHRFREQRYGEGLLAASEAVIAVLQQNREELSMTPAQRADAAQRREQQRMEELARGQEHRLLTLAGAGAAATLLYLLIALLLRINAQKKFIAGSKLDQTKAPADQRPLAPLPIFLWLPLILVWPAIALVLLYWALFTFHFLEHVGSDQYLGIILGGAAYFSLSLLALLKRLQRAAMILNETTSPFLKHAQLRQSNKGILAGIILAPWFYLPYFLFTRWKMRTLRLTPRVCPKCNALMHRLGEANDDPYLEAGQRTEEQIGSVDYDVWFCSNDEQTLIQRYPENSAYEQCEKCSYVTSRVVRSRTVRSPTYESEGAGEHEHECRHCGRKKLSSYSIAKLVRSSSSSSSGGGYRSSGGSSSSSGSRSSSGSFGGGRSGGGGAGVSW
ncbi:MAG: TPM domain-containing protein [Leptospirales bacterium]|nr:TPM domain-containing protein [Leptospirales bacterium]